MVFKPNNNNNNGLQVATI